MKTCIICNSEKSLSEFYSGRNQCKVCFIDKKKRYHVENDRTEKQKAYRDVNKEKAAQYRLDNKDHRTQWINENRDVLNTRMRKYVKHRRLTDPQFRITNNIRNSIRTSFKRNILKKSKLTSEIETSSSNSI